MDELYATLCLHSKRLREIAEHLPVSETLLEAYTSGLLTNLHKDGAALQAQAIFGAQPPSECTLAAIMQDLERMQIHRRQWFNEPLFNPFVSYEPMLKDLREKDHSATSFVHKLELIGVADETLSSLRKEQVKTTPLFLASDFSHNVLVGLIEYTRPAISRLIVEKEYVLLYKGDILLCTNDAPSFKTPTYPRVSLTLDQFLSDA